MLASADKQEDFAVLIFKRHHGATKCGFVVSKLDRVCDRVLALLDVGKRVNDLDARRPVTGTLGPAELFIGTEDLLLLVRLARFGEELLLCRGWESVCI